MNYALFRPPIEATPSHSLRLRFLPTRITHDEPFGGAVREFPTSPIKSIRKIIQEAFHPIRSPQVYDSDSYQSRFGTANVRQQKRRPTAAIHQRSFLCAI